MSRINMIHWRSTTAAPHWSPTAIEFGAIEFVVPSPWNVTIYGFLIGTRAIGTVAKLEPRDIGVTPPPLREFYRQISPIGIRGFYSWRDSLT